MKQKLVATGLFLCEQVIIEEKTRNVTLVNCFTRRVVEGFPSEPFPFVVFAILTDGLGEILLEVVIQRLDDLEEIYRREHSFRFTSPLHNIRFRLRIQDCSFPVSGHYQVSLFAENELIAQQKIVVLGKEQSP